MEEYKPQRRHNDEKPLISLRVGSAKNPRDSLSPIYKMYHLSLSIPKNCLNTM